MLGPSISHPVIRKTTDDLRLAVRRVKRMPDRDESLRRRAAEATRHFDERDGEAAFGSSQRGEDTRAAAADHDDIVIIRQTGESGSLLVSDCSFARVSKTEKIKAYEGNGNVRWRDNFYAGNWEGVPCPGAKADEAGRPLGSSNVKLAE